MKTIKDFGHQITVYDNGYIAHGPIRYAPSEHEKVLELAYDIERSDQLFLTAKALRDAVKFAKNIDSITKKKPNPWEKWPRWLGKWGWYSEKMNAISGHAIYNNHQGHPVRVTDVVDGRVQSSAQWDDIYLVGPVTDWKYHVPAPSILGNFTGHYAP